MSEVIRSFLSYLAGNWPELLWILVAAGCASYIAGRRARSRWMKRDFLNRLNVTLTSVDEGTLRIRTILEMDCDAIFLNPTAANAIVKYAKLTTKEDPILPIPEDDCWQYLNAVLNEISEHFSEGQIKRDLGLKVERGEFVLCLTCERAGEIRTQKVRGMLIRKSLLTNLPEEQPNLESPLHITRWQTLKQIAEQYQNRPHRFIDIEICV